MRKSFKSKTLANIQIYELKTFDFNLCFKDENQFDSTTAEFELQQQKKLMDQIEVYISKCDSFIANRAPNMINVMD